jgi:hypothetical protein
MAGARASIAVDRLGSTPIPTQQSSRLTKAKGYFIYLFIYLLTHICDNLCHMIFLLLATTTLIILLLATSTLICIGAPGRGGPGRIGGHCPAGCPACVHYQGYRPFSRVPLHSPHASH